jgi:hypothetical protein
LEEWQELYLGLDVEAEARKALAYVRENTGRRKTPRGMPAFLVRWFNRATDRGARAPAPIMRREPVDDGWFDECQRLHGGGCGGSLRHRTRMQIDAHRRVSA